MPSPIIHLEILYQLAKQQNMELDPDLIQGVISPDAIHMRANQTWEDKSKTHYYKLADESYFLALEKAKNELRKTTKAFTLGYLIHLYTDYFWRETIYTPFFMLRKEEMPRQDLHALYYKQMQQLDYAILKDATWIKKAQNSLDEVTFKGNFKHLTQQEINQWSSKVVENDLKVVGEGLNLHYPKLFPKPLIEAFNNEILTELADWISKI